MPDQDRAAPPGWVHQDLAISLTLLRLVRGYSQAELAERSGLTSSALSEYERGKVDPQTQTLQKLLSGLGLPHSALDDAAHFILRIRALSIPDTERSSDETQPAEAPDRRVRRARRTEVAQLASEAGRFASKFVFFLFEDLDSRRGPG